MASPYSVEKLYDTGDVPHYSREADAIAFPLGGIGTGNVSLGVRGQLTDWEIFNHPSKGIDLPYAFFALRCARGDEEPVTRVLEGKHTPPYTHWYGMPPTTTAGLPRLDEVDFVGRYPVAEIEFQDEATPVDISLEAYTPFIPLEPQDSGIPAAVLEYTVSNPTSDTTEVSLVGSLPNVIGYLGEEQIDRPRVEHSDLGGNQNKFREGDNVKGLHYTTERYDDDERRFGELGLFLVDVEEEVTHKSAWSREDWWNNYQLFWNDFRDDGRLDANSYDEPSEEGTGDVGSLATTFELEPGEEHTVTYLLTWYNPNRENSWDAMFSGDDETDADCGCADGSCGTNEDIVQNYYATEFDGVWDVATYVADDFSRLREQTFAFRDALFDSTIPTHVLDAVSSQLSVARSTTCIWFEDGSFLGFEGCAEQQGCCEGTCTHVWNYAQSLARLFPSLEREMRRIDFLESTDDDGFMQFRTPLPLDRGIDRESPPAADGQMGTVMRLYREWLYSGDEEFLAELWPAAKRALEFAFTEWDPDEDGVMTEAQHNTYDIEFYGPNTMTGSWYLGALKAGTEMAHAIGDEEAANHYEAVFESGREKLDKACWNGEYFKQDLEDPEAHKYQYGEGCLIDQVVGDWNARMLGLGHVLPEAHVQSALTALFEHNFLNDFSTHHNTNRTYALNDDAGLLMCRWPRGGRPSISFPYCDEVMSGFAYQVASHMIYEGLIDEGLTVVKAIRDRHDGVKRNPWNEFECGNHYARTMANWSVYEALCGYEFDLTGRRNDLNEYDFNVDPALDQEEFQCLWITDEGWGTYQQTSSEGELRKEITDLSRG